VAVALSGVGIGDDHDVRNHNLTLQKTNIRADYWLRMWPKPSAELYTAWARSAAGRCVKDPFQLILGYIPLSADICRGTKSISHFLPPDLNDE
jgi:hypothetical protein